MNRWNRMIAGILCLVLVFGMGACKRKESAEDQAGAATYVPSEQASEKDVVLPNQTGSETAPQKEETPTVQPPSEDQEESNRPAAATLALCTYPEVAPYQPDEKVYSKEERKALRKKWNEEREAERELAQSAGEIDSFWLKTLDPCLADEGNTLYSPINMYLMMALLTETTEGAAQAELLALLDAASVEEVRQKATALWKSHYRADGAVDLILACSIWLAQELDCNAETLDRLQSNYYVSVFRGMMGSEAYNQMLRDWLNEQTGGLLQNQIKQVRLDEGPLIRLVTTVYFTAQWEHKYQSAGVAPFYNGVDGATCEYLKNDAVADYYWGKQFTAVDCEFDDDGKGGKMRIILPQKGLDAHSLLKESELQSFITSETWAQTKRAVVHQRIPKFDIDQKQDLTPALRSLGVRKIFSSTDSLKPLLGNQKATIDKLEQAARVLIDEEGCKAAAYTQTLRYSGNYAPEEVDFVVDRPFIFVLYSEHNLPLFVGVVSQV